MLTFPSRWPPLPPPWGTLERRTAYGHNKVTLVVQKDTVTADEEDDEIHAHQHPWEEGAAIGHDTIIHDHIPVLTRQDLHKAYNRQIRDPGWMRKWGQWKGENSESGSFPFTLLSRRKEKSHTHE